jgi:hypothetical protein
MKNDLDPVVAVVEQLKKHPWSNVMPNILS